MVEINECYEIKDSNHENGVYRVVGTEENIVMLKVGDLHNNRLHTGQLVQVTEDELDQFKKVEIPKENLKQKILSEIKMLPYVLIANYHRMKDNWILNVISGAFQSAGLIMSFLNLDYPTISSLLILSGSLGLALSMSLFYNHR